MSLSRAGIAGIALAATVGAAAVVGGGVLAWRAVGPDTFAEVDIRGVEDPQRVADGNRLLAEVSAPAGARRDPYGTACGVGESSLCMSSESLSPRDLLDAVVDELRGQQAKVERRWCEETLCFAHLEFKGTPLLVTVDETAAEFGPATVSGGVVTNQENSLPAAPLGSWDSLSATPVGWNVPTCGKPESEGCARYDGVHPIEGAAADSLAALRQALAAGAYRIDQDTCPPEGAVESNCAITARRFRTLGGLDRMTARFEFRTTNGTGFKVMMSASPDD